MPALAEPIAADAWGPRTMAAQVLRPPRLSRAREDDGLFGSGSAAWQVWSAQSLVIAIVRGAILQMYEPVTGAGVAQRSAYQQDPLGRLRRTADYFTTVIYGDGRSVVQASEQLHRIHQRMKGIEPIGGAPYDANDPHSQRWVHVTAWHSVLYCYERYGPGRLTAERELEYWRQCQIAAELQTVDPADVPGSRTEVRAYFESMRPRICLSEATRDVVDWLLAPNLGSSLARASIEAAFVLAGRAAAATIPTYMRELGGFDHPRIADAAIIPIARAGARTLDAPALRSVFAAVSPEAYAVREAALHGPSPANSGTVTVAEARRAHRRSVSAAA